MKTMKTFWMDSNLANLIKKVFPHQQQSEFIRNSVEHYVAIASKRIWNPIGYIHKVSGLAYGTYTFKYFFGYYPRLKRQFIFVKDLDGTSFINSFPESKNLLLAELGIVNSDEVDILFRSMNKDTYGLKSGEKPIWNVLCLNSECVSVDIELDYKKFIEKYVTSIYYNTTNYSLYRHYGVLESLGFPIDINLDGYEDGVAPKILGHLEPVESSDEYKNMLLQKEQLKKIPAKLQKWGKDELLLEDELFLCRSHCFNNDNPKLFFELQFKTNNLIVFPCYEYWQRFCADVLKANIIDDTLIHEFTSGTYTINNNHQAVFGGMMLDMTINTDNVKLQEFIKKVLALQIYKDLVNEFTNLGIGA